MFERFTERARHVVVVAQSEARTLGHSRIGTELLLLGVLRDDERLAARVLATFGLDLEIVRAQVIAAGGGGYPGDGVIPFTSQAQDALAGALREALALSHNYIGPEHILLAIVRDPDGLTAAILDAARVDYRKLRDRMVPMLEGRGRHVPGSVVYIGYRIAPQHVQIACPRCGAILEQEVAEGDQASFSLDLDVETVCPGCQRLWKLTYHVAWEELEPPPDAAT